MIATTFKPGTDLRAGDTVHGEIGSVLVTRVIRRRSLAGSVAIVSFADGTDAELTADDVVEVELEDES